MPTSTDSTNLHILDRKLFLALRTQVLRDQKGELIGWFVRDTDVQHGTQQKVLCVNVLYWRATKTKQSLRSLGLVRGFDYAKEENVDFVALEAVSEHPRRYRRVGRGRVVTKG